MSQRSIDPPVFYKTIQFDSQTLNGDFSEEYVAGFLIGLQTFAPNSYLPKIDNLTIDNIHTTTLDFLVLDHLPMEDVIPKSSSVEKDEIGWWIINPDSTYNLYGFFSQGFISGFIKCSQMLNLDFRDFIAGPPFYIKNQQKIPLLILGYEIKVFDPRPRVETPLMPYETMVYQTGIYDYN